MPNIDLSILNQRQTPAFYASSLATRPAFGFAGRIFIDTDSPSTGLYRDTGAAWVQIADPGAGTTGTLQQVTTNGKTTNQGITITAGGLTLGTNTGDNQTLLNLPGNTSLLYRENVGSLYGFDIGPSDNSLFLNTSEGNYYQTLYFGDGITTNIFGISASNDIGVTYNPVFVVNQNKLVGINTNAPTATFDVHGDVNVIQQLNQTIATNNSLLAFQNSGTGKWRIGSFYNSGAEDFGIFDVVGAIQPVTIKKTTGQVLIGTSTVGSGKLVVASATGDNGIQIVGASAPSLRIDNAESGPTKRAGFGISTATNNFIQGSADRDFCMFNGSTTASPILFGIYDAAAVNVQEAARISPARNFLIGTTTDNGSKLQVSGAATFSSNVNINTGGASFQWTNSGNNVALLADSGYLRFDTGTSGYNERMRLTASGDLLFKGRSTTANYDVFFYNDNNQFDINATNTSGTKMINFNVSSFVSSMRLAATGNLLIGTTTDSGYKLEIQQGSTAAGLWVQTGGTTAASVIADFRTGTNARALGLLGNGKVNMPSLPTSSVGLSSGDLWNNLGIVNIIP